MSGVPATEPPQGCGRCGHRRWSHNPRGLRPCHELVDAPPSPRDEIEGKPAAVECPCAGLVEVEEAAS